MEQFKILILNSREIFDIDNEQEMLDSLNIIRNKNLICWGIYLNNHE